MSCWYPLCPCAWALLASWHILASKLHEFGPCWSRILRLNVSDWIVFFQSGSSKTRQVSKLSCQALPRKTTRWNQAFVIPMAMSYCECRQKVWLLTGSGDWGGSPKVHCRSMNLYEIVTAGLAMSCPMFSRLTFRAVVTLRQIWMSTLF